MRHSRTNQPFCGSGTFTCRQTERYGGTGRRIFALLYCGHAKNYTNQVQRNMKYEDVPWNHRSRFQTLWIKNIELENEFLHKALITERIDVLRDNLWPQYTIGTHVSRAFLSHRFPEIVCYQQTSWRTPNATEHCISPQHILWYAWSLLWLPTCTNIVGWSLKNWVARSTDERSCDWDTVPLYGWTVDAHLCVPSKTAISLLAYSLVTDVAIYFSETVDEYHS